MRTLALALWFGIGVAHGWADSGERVLMQVDWNPATPREGQPGEVVREPDGRFVWRIQHTNAGPLEVRLWTGERPAITNLVYVVRGEVAYESVTGDGFLELWNVFPPTQAGLPEARYFSRTLAERGAMGLIRGTSGWREFELPFDRHGTSNAPTRLELNLHLAGPGTVRVGRVRLLEYPGLTSLGSAKTSGAWWSPRTTGWLGGVAGGVFGTLGGLLGTLAGLGRARSFVLGAVRACVGLGLLIVASGVVAIGARQPFYVWSTLLFTGALLASIFASNLKSLRARFDAGELRRMTALDAGGR